MLLSPRKNGLTSLSKEVRVFKVCDYFGVIGIRALAVHSSCTPRFWQLATGPQGHHILSFHQRYSCAAAEREQGGREYEKI